MPSQADCTKLREELEDIHALFRAFVQGRRAQLDMEKVATGEAWHGSKAWSWGWWTNSRPATRSFAAPASAAAAVVQ